VDPALADLLRRVPDPRGRMVEAIIRLRRPDAEVPGVRIVTQLGRIATCRIPLDAVRRVHAHHDVLALKAARPIGPRTTTWSSTTPTTRPPAGRPGST